MKGQLTLARSQMEKGQWEEAAAILDEILTSVPESTATQNLKRRCLDKAQKKQKEQEKKKRMEERLASIDTKMSAGDFQGVLSAVDEVLDEQPGQQRALALKTRAQQGLQEEQRIREHLVSAQRKIEGGDLESALESAGEAVRLAPENTEAQQLQERIRQQLTIQAQTQQQIQEAGDNLESGALEQALSSAREVLQSQPEHSEAQRIEQDARQQLLGKAREAASQNRFQAALEGLDEITRLDAEGASKNVLSQADEEIRQLREDAAKRLKKQQQEIERQLLDAERLFRDSALPESSEILDRILTLDPEQERALELKSQVASALEKEKARQEAQEKLSRARELAQSEDLEASLQTAIEASQLDPDDTGIIQFINRLQPRYEAWKEEDDRRKRIAQELGSARSALAWWRLRAAEQSLDACWNWTPIPMRLSVWSNPWPNAKRSATSCSSGLLLGQACCCW